MPPKTNLKPETNLTPSSVRVNRFLASAGLGSRRSCEEDILEGRVSINGSVCRNLATRVMPEDDVRVKGRQVHQSSHRYILLHKPSGYVSTRSDRFAARTIFDLLPSDASHLFHVGRLDKDSEGLLLLTNDGLFAQNLLHPSRGIDKEYEVTLDQPFTPKVAAALKKGIWMEGSVARIESVKQLSPYRIKLVLHQGLKRQIRVMLGTLGFKVKRLVRIRLGPLKIHGLALGRYRDLKKEELEALRQVTSTSAPKKLHPKKAISRIQRTGKSPDRMPKAAPKGRSERTPASPRKKEKLATKERKKTTGRGSASAHTAGRLAKERARGHKRVTTKKRF